MGSSSHQGAAGLHILHPQVPHHTSTSLLIYDGFSSQSRGEKRGSQPTGTFSAVTSLPEAVLGHTGTQTTSKPAWPLLSRHLPSSGGPRAQVKFLRHH